MIFYSVRLNKRIVMLRDGEADLQRMISQFNDTSVVVQDSARKLRSAGTEAEFGVKAAVAKGMALRNELDVMLEQAELLVDKLNDNPGRFENSSPTRPVPSRPVPSRRV